MRSRNKGGAPPNLEKETSAPPQPSKTKGKSPPHAPKQEESPRPLSQQESRAPFPKGKALYVIFHKKRLRASSKCTKKENSISNNRQALPNHRETRELRLPLRWRDETSSLPLWGKKILTISFCFFKRWKKAYTQEERVELPPTFKKRNLVLCPAFNREGKSPTAGSKTRSISLQLALL